MFGDPPHSCSTSSLDLFPPLPSDTSPSISINELSSKRVSLVIHTCHTHQHPREDSAHQILYILGPLVHNGQLGSEDTQRSSLSMVPSVFGFWSTQQTSSSGVICFSWYHSARFASKQQQGTSHGISSIHWHAFKLAMVIHSNIKFGCRNSMNVSHIHECFLLTVFFLVPTYYSI